MIVGVPPPKWICRPSCAVRSAAIQVEFAAQRRDIGRNRLVAARDRGVTAAIPAHRPAERDVQIEGGGGFPRNRLQPFGVGFQSRWFPRNAGRSDSSYSAAVAPRNIWQSRCASNLPLRARGTRCAGQPRATITMRSLHFQCLRAAELPRKTKCLAFHRLDLSQPAGLALASLLLSPPHPQAGAAGKGVRERRGIVLSPLGKREPWRLRCSSAAIEPARHGVELAGARPAAP